MYSPTCSDCRYRSTDCLEAARGQSFAQGLTEEIEKTIESISLDELATEIPKSIDQSLSGVQRVAKIVQAMKDFSHPGTEIRRLPLTSIAPSRAR